MKRRLLAAGVLAFALAIPVSSQAGKGTISAASITITVHALAVSTSKDCSHPIVVFTSDAGIESDLLSDPTYGSGPVDPGTYECVIIEMSKVIKTSAAATSGSCIQGQEFSDVICGGGQASQLVDGTPVTCSDAAGPQNVTLFITTASAGASGERSLLPPTSAGDATSGLKLTSPLVIGGDTPVTLRVDPTRFLDGTGPSCATSAPSFSVD